MHKNRFNTGGAMILGLAVLSFLTAGNASAQSSIKDVDNPARQPWAYTATLQMHAGIQQDQETIIIVPAGKRLVIETYTIHFYLIGTQRMEAKIDVSSGGGFGQHRLHKTYRSESPWTVAEATNNVRFYADPGTAVVLRISRGINTDGNAAGHFSFSGHFINLP